MGGAAPAAERKWVNPSWYEGFDWLAKTERAHWSQEREAEEKRRVIDCGVWLWSINSTAWSIYQPCFKLNRLAVPSVSGSRSWPEPRCTPSVLATWLRGSLSSHLKSSANLIYNPISEDLKRILRLSNAGSGLLSSPTACGRGRGGEGCRGRGWWRRFAVAWLICVCCRERRQLAKVGYLYLYLSLSISLFLHPSSLSPTIKPMRPLMCAGSQQLRSESICSDCVIFEVASIVANHVPLVLLLLQGLWLQAQVR